MDKRPYFSKTVDELTEIFEKNKDKQRILKSLLKELSYRSRPKAKKLAILINEHLATQEVKAQPVQQNLVEPQAKKLEQATLPIVVKSAVPEETPKNSNPVEVPKRKKWPWLLGLAVLAVVCCGYLYWQHDNETPDIFKNINGHENIDKQVDYINQAMKIIRQ